MIRFTKNICAVIVLVLLALPLAVSAAESGRAGLLLLPTRIELTERDRNVELLIKNNGTARGLYRVEVADMEMPEEGPIQAIEEGKPAPYSVKEFTRVSPRRIILEPDQTQAVRIIVRKPSNLEDGEYRSHVKVTIVENNVDKQGNPAELKANSKNVTVQVKARFSMAIPLIMRQGNPKVSMKIGETKLRSEGDTLYLDTELLREGDRSAYGDVKVTYKAPDGKETVLQFKPGLAVYRPTPKRKLAIDLDVPKGLSLKGGTLKVRYTAQEKDGGAVLAEKEIGV